MAADIGRVTEGAEDRGVRELFWRLRRAVGGGAHRGPRSQQSSYHGFWAVTRDLFSAPELPPILDAHVSESWGFRTQNVVSPQKASGVSWFSAWVTEAHFTPIRQSGGSVGPRPKTLS